MQENAERCENALGDVGEFRGKAFAPCSRENEMSNKWDAVHDRMADTIVGAIVKSVTANPDRQLSEIGFRWACALALKSHWRDVDIPTAADWLTEYVGAPVGTDGYSWSYRAAQDLARQYVAEYGEAA